MLQFNATFKQRTSSSSLLQENNFWVCSEVLVIRGYFLSHFVCLKLLSLIINKHSDDIYIKYGSGYFQPVKDDSPRSRGMRISGQINNNKTNFGKNPIINSDLMFLKPVKHKRPEGNWITLIILAFLN